MDDTVLKLFVICPTCRKGESSIHHLNVGFEFHWFCDECGQGYTGIRTTDGVKGLKAEARASKKVRMLVEYVEDPRLKFIVEGIELTEFTDKETPGEIASSHRYYIGEHTCPSNTMSAVEDVIFENDHDPHGVFQFVKVLGLEKEHVQ